MGATVWQRDEAGGKTFTVGPSAATTTSRTPQQPSQRPGKRKKLVWSRNDAAGTPTTSGHPSPPSTAPASGAAADGAAQPAKRQRSAATAAADVRPAASAIPAQHSNGAANGSRSGHATNGTVKGDSNANAAAPVKPPIKAPLGAGLARQLRQKEAELERMRQEMYAKQRRLHEEQEAVRRAEAAEEVRLKVEREAAEKRRQRLEAGFAQVFRQAQEEVASEAKFRKTIATADAAEVARVLGARSDYDCLQLPAGAAAADIRRKYKEMAVSLHPDKCRVDGAADAFRRIVQAQQNLLKFAA